MLSRANLISSLSKYRNWDVSVFVFYFYFCVCFHLLEPTQTCVLFWPFSVFQQTSVRRDIWECRINLNKELTLSALPCTHKTIFLLISYLSAFLDSLHSCSSSTAQKSQTIWSPRLAVRKSDQFMRMLYAFISNSSPRWDFIQFMQFLLS